ncbi:serine protease Hayan-like [Leptopilina heterotoma]|uniref:serine protease Hayan-like n=1 Tax=Leptopilina heterotoma TaxID=63436 RepID=UPI001CAA170B|nr:serine protease Hayan-like [Leptopilina heterotoma]
MIFYLIFLQIFQILLNTCFTLTSDFVFPNQLYDGSECLLNANNENGTCKEFLKCQQILNEIENGLRSSNFQDHCSLYGSKELVCCPLQQVSTYVEFGLRPSDVAKNSGIIIQEKIIENLDSEVAREGEFPFIASLGYRINNDTSNKIDYKCGGSLINTLFVLTAAHCMINVNNDLPIEVRLGFVNENISTNGVQRIPIVKYYSHPNYNPFEHYYDIGLVKLGKPAEITATVRPIFLYVKPIASEFTEKNNLFTAGFNVNKAGFEYPEKILRFFNLKLVDKSRCSQLFRGISDLPFGLDESMKCGKDVNDKRLFDVCQGDSGGPLFLKKENTFSLAGVIAFGIGCTGHAPTVYISIYHYLDWIETQVRSS